jgi:hypothetical protein
MILIGRIAYISLCAALLVGCDVASTPAQPPAGATDVPASSTAYPQPLVPTTNGTAYPPPATPGALTAYPAPTTSP